MGCRINACASHFNINVSSHPLNIRHDGIRFDCINDLAVTKFQSLHIEPLPLEKNSTSHPFGSSGRLPYLIISDDAKIF